MLHSGLCIMYNRAVRARWQFYCVQWSCARYVTILLCTIELCALCDSLTVYNGAVHALWQSYCVQWSCARYVTILLCTMELCALCDNLLGAEVAQLVGHRTGTLPMQARFPGAARDFSPRVNFQCRLSYGVRTPPCSIACIYICAHVKDPVVHVRVLCIIETLKHGACTVE